MVEKDPTPGDASPERILGEKKGEELKRDSSDQEPDEHGINSHINGTTILYYTICDIHKFPHRSGNLSKNGDEVPHDLVSLLRELLKRERWAMLDYYFKHGAATVWILRYSLNMSKTAAYRWHKLIEESGLIEIKTTISPIGKMKKPASIWGLQYSSESQVRDAYQYHLKLTSPIYRKADKLAKRYIQEGKPAITSIGKLIRYLKDINEPARMRHDLAVMMLKILSGELKTHILIDQSEREENLRRVLEIIEPPIDRITTINETMNQIGINNPETRAYIRKHYEDETAKIISSR